MPFQCEKCETPIIWLKHHQTKKSNPVEAVPHKNGNLAISRELGLYRIATPAEVEAARSGKGKLYISHFAICAHAKSFRK